MTATMAAIVQDSGTNGRTDGGEEAYLARLASPIRSPARLLAPAETEGKKGGKKRIEAARAATPLERAGCPHRKRSEWALYWRTR